jgi:mxaK protein
VVAGLLTSEAIWLYRLHALNAIIDAATAPQPATPAPALGTNATPPAASFAYAYSAGRKGDTLSALSLYREAARDARFAPAAFFNSANLHMRVAQKAMDDPQLEEEQRRSESARALELAKQQYREALRVDPALWEAKYNLERALRLAPESDGDTDLPPAPQAERAVTTMRGFTLGLP